MVVDMHEHAGLGILYHTLVILIGLHLTFHARVNACYIGPFKCILVMLIWLMEKVTKDREQTLKT